MAKPKNIRELHLPITQDILALPGLAQLVREFMVAEFGDRYLGADVLEEAFVVIEEDAVEPVIVVTLEFADQEDLNSTMPGTRAYVAARAELEGEGCWASEVQLVAERSALEEEELFYNRFITLFGKAGAGRSDV